MQFGHKQLQGTAAYLAGLLQHEIGCKTRSVEFSTLQRSASHMASRVDIDEAFMVAAPQLRPQTRVIPARWLSSTALPMILT